MSKPLKAGGAHPHQAQLLKREPTTVGPRQKQPCGAVLEAFESLAVGWLAPGRDLDELFHQKAHRDGVALFWRHKNPCYGFTAAKTRQSLSWFYYRKT
jgi:hypothetical protein